MGRLNTVVTFLNAELKEFQRTNQRKFNQSFLDQPQTIMQKVTKDAKMRRLRIFRYFHQNPESLTVFAKYWIRMLERAKPWELLNAAPETQETPLSSYFESVSNGDPETQFQIVRSLALGKDTNQLHIDFEIEYEKVQNMRTRGEKRLIDLCQSIASMYEIFYKHYANMLFFCRLIENGKVPDATKKVPYSHEDAKVLGSLGLYDRKIRGIRNGASHKEWYYSSGKNHIEIRDKGRLVGRFKAAELITVIEDIRSAQQNVRHYFTASRFALDLMANLIEHMKPEMIAMLEYRRN